MRHRCSGTPAAGLLVLVLLTSACAHQPRGLNKEQIRTIIRGHLDVVKFCYEKELSRSPNIQGRVFIKFTIAEAGKVIDSTVQSSTVNNEAVERCIAAAVREWVFPDPHGTKVTVSYPFVLRTQ